MILYRDNNDTQIPHHIPSLPFTDVYGHDSFIHLIALPNSLIYIWKQHKFTKIVLNSEFTIQTKAIYSFKKKRRNAEYINRVENNTSRPLEF